MEPSDSSTRPIPLTIDLNSTPSPSSDSSTPPPLCNPLPFIRSLCYITPSDGLPASLPRPSSSTCPSCASNLAAVYNDDGRFAVCDSCERGFHLACVSRMRPEEVVDDEWRCEECVRDGEKSKRWKLGRSGSVPAGGLSSSSRSKCSTSSNRGGGGVRLLDINALPVSDGEGSEGLPDDSRKQTPGDYSLDDSSCGAPSTTSNYLPWQSNGFVHQAFENKRRIGKLCSEDTLNQRHFIDRNIEDCIQLEGLGRNGDAAVSFKGQNLSEMFLQALREYISEKHGLLEDGWHVQFRETKANAEQYALYCSPDGKMFESMSEVAFYLGLVSNAPGVRNEEPKLPQKRSRQTKRRKYKQTLIANGFSKSKDTSVTGSYMELSFNMKSTAVCNNSYNNLGCVVNSTESTRNHFVDTEYQQLNDGLPVQYEDFFVLSLGKIVCRSSYHDADQIWPVGYRSCWHDKITGSLFICDVLDGGISGPIFRVKRCSCSSLPIPVGTTTLVMSNACVPQDQNEESRNIICNMDYCEDLAIQTIFTDSCLPGENDLLSCLGSSHDKDSVSQTPEKNQTESVSHQEFVPSRWEFKDEIGEIIEEGRVLSSVWRIACRKIIEKYREAYRQTGTCKFLCKHFEHVPDLHGWSNLDEKAKVGWTSLAKFCSSSGFSNVASVIHSDSQLETVTGLLEKWLYQDRFGLDVEFVQEILEHLPGFQACTNYVNLHTRYSTMLTVGSGLLIVKTESGFQGREEEIINGLFGGSKESRIKLSKDVRIEPFPPLGKPLGSVLPLELVGDVLQVSEFIWRFYEILGLQEPLLFEELEKELVNPWSDVSVISEEVKNEVEDSENLFSHKNSAADGDRPSDISSSNEPEPMPLDKIQTFSQMEGGVTKVANQNSLASITYSRCTGAVLRKAHCSLLKVLVTELLAKVAVLVVPNIDAGEYKSRRGKKRDIDSSLPSKKTKLNVLPINELSWPDLARRYILAVLTMDGNLDSAEIANHESGRVFRCLHGDGGVLCGSLTGVAGMEADALLLAEATRKVYVSLKRENDSIIVENEGPDATDECEASTENGCVVPEWALALEPARKLPTNVGTRIRKCVYDALEKNPPEWARSILIHSISKEVYKGNASGPTKKAVISVLDKVRVEQIQHKPAVEKKQSVMTVSIPDTIMKVCRVILRRVAAEDDRKVFCNLLGKKLMHSSDNDDEGLLASPAMVSRPLDFRTIDLRLAYGAYNGSHEAFLEDVHELWNNIRIAYGDQPELTELADTLSHSFEALYETEVLAVAEKLKSAKSEPISAETKKELNDILLVTNEIPRAPWDEGICKVCGVDRDDDSVLLCDTCDAEYHTYCLNPPLARIPDGNWYCPSCIAGKYVQVESEVKYSFGRRGKKRYQGEYTRRYLEALTNLGSIMEKKEYWDFSIHERVFLLKFLCDELLNSALLRQHLEQCADTSSDLQQKMRSFSMEWKNLKLKEDTLSARAAKIQKDQVEAARSVSTPTGVNAEAPLQNGINKHISPSHSENLLTCNGEEQVSGATLKDDGEEQVSGATLKDDGEEQVSGATLKDEYLNGKKSMSSSVPQVQSMDNLGAGNCSGLQDLCFSTEVKDVHVPESVPVNNSHDHNLELSAARSDMLLLQESIANVESQVLKLASRREFLGSDSSGRMYWVSPTLGRYPSLIVDRSEALQQQKGTANSLKSIANSTTVHQSPWIYYQSEEEFEQLIRWLKDTEPKDRELKESILHLRKLKFQVNQHPEIQAQKEPQTAYSDSTRGTFNFLSTRAAILLEMKYGPCFNLGSSELSQNQGRENLINEGEKGKMYRCDCLELVWPSRPHCFSCHRTFLTGPELEEHNEDGCTTASSPYENCMENLNLQKEKRSVSSGTRREHSKGNEDVKGTKSGCPEFSSSLLQFQNDGLICPYDFEEISAKFVTNDSNKELVEGIGLIGSNGVPQFVSSMPPYLSDPALLLVSPKNATKTNSQPNPSDMNMFTQKMGPKPPGGKEFSSSIQNSVGKRSSDSTDVDKLAGRRLEQKDKRPRQSYRASVMDVSRCCVVPQSSLKPLVGKVSQILMSLKMNLLDMDAALHEEALRPSRAQGEKRWAWRAFVKSANTIFEMVQATVVLEDMIKTDHMSNNWWYWSSFSAAAKVSTLSSLALRVYALDASIIYEKISSDTNLTDSVSLNNHAEQNSLLSSDPTEKAKNSRRPSKRRKEAEG